MKRRRIAAILAVPVLATAAATTLTAAAAPASATVPVRGPFLYWDNFDTTCGTQAGQVLGSFTATVPHANADGSYDVQFHVAATFVTLRGPSFNACNVNTHVNSGRTIREGVSGSYVTTAVLHLTSAGYTGVTSCPRDQNGACGLVAYLHAAYGDGVVFTQTSVHAVLHSSAPRLISRQATEDCSGAACAAGHLKITGDIASGHSA